MLSRTAAGAVSFSANSETVARLFRLPDGASGKIGKAA
jgi:hypothetical protein